MLSRSGSGEPAAELDLSACDREPIHIPGAIQSHGVLLVADRSGDAARRGGERAHGLSSILVRFACRGLSRPSNRRRGTPGIGA